MHGKYSKILVTGGAGFIGSHIVERLLLDDYQVSVLDNLSTGCLENIPHKENKAFTFIKGDITDVDDIKNALEDVDAVFHEAALVSVIRSIKEPVLTNDINLSGTLNMLKISADLGVRRFVLASSAAVYGEDTPPIKKEEMSTFPANPYGVTKLACEHYARVFHKLYGLETVSLRYFNVYGPRQSFSIEHAYGGVITLFLNRLLSNMPPIIYGDGEQSRDFVYVKDIAEANINAMNTNGAEGQVFNIGNGTPTTVNSVSNTLKTLLKNDLSDIHESSRIGELRHGYADISKAVQTLKFSPKYTLQSGLAELVDWRRKQFLAQS